MIKRLTLFLAVITGITLLLFSQSEAGKLIQKKSYPTPQTSGKLPIIFSPDYDISILGLENLHPFDSKKYGKVFRYLNSKSLLSESSIFTPEPVSDSMLLQVHSREYLESLKKSKTIARVAEMPMLSKLPNKTLQKSLLRPMKLATGGSILGVQLALDSGYAINLSGGYHHAKSGNGEGFCFFADINLAILQLQKLRPGIKVMIVDLDAHQGNGHEAISQDAEDIIIYDMYNADVYPMDDNVKQYIDFDIPLSSFTSDSIYLHKLYTSLPKAISSSKPDFILYNAGTDIYEKDPLGRLSVSSEGIINRDEFVFDQALSNDIPILMVLSGGYSKESASIIGRSIENIIRKNEF